VGRIAGFDLQEKDVLPVDDMHTLFRMVGDRGKIWHSKEVTEAELDVARGMLQRGHATAKEIKAMRQARAARDAK
jgi:hypothetical protein